MDAALIAEMNQLKRWFSPNTVGAEKSLFSAEWRLTYYLKRHEHEIKKREDAGFSWPEIVDDPTVSMLWKNIQDTRETVREWLLVVHKGKRLAYLLNVYALHKDKLAKEPKIFRIPTLPTSPGVQLTMFNYE